LCLVSDSEMHRYAEAEKGHSRSIASDEDASQLVAHIYIQMYSLYIVTCDYSRKRAFRPEESGRTGSRPLGLSDLSRMANRGRDYNAIRLSPCCRAAYVVGNTGLPAKMSLSGRISAVCSESHFRRKWNAHSEVGTGLIRKSRNVIYIFGWKYVCRLCRSVSDT